MYGTALGALGQAFMKQNEGINRLAISGLTSEGAAEKVASDVAGKYAQGALGALSGAMQSYTSGVTGLESQYMSGVEGLAQTWGNLQTGESRALAAAYAPYTSMYENMQNLLNLYNSFCADYSILL